MAVQLTLDRYGVTPMDRCQVGVVPGLQPQRGPSSATGGSDVIAGSGVTQSRATGSQYLKIAQWNAEGLREKKQDLQKFLRQHNIDVCCVQETHLNNNQVQRFFIRGYETYRQDREGRSKGGILTLVKNSIPSVEFIRSERRDTEYIGIKIILNTTSTISVLNLYSPPDKAIELDEMEPSESNWIILGDFNSHSPSWGYDDLNAKGEEVESWSISNQLQLLNHPNDTPTCYSRAWRTCSTPDLAFATEDLHKAFNREICNQLGGSDHRPVIIHLNQEMVDTTRLQPSWNYKKADWEHFSSLADAECSKITVSHSSIEDNVKKFNAAVLEAAKHAIPRGKRRNYKPFWSQHLQDLEKEVTDARDTMEASPTDANVIDHNRKKAKFTRAKIEETRKSWHEKTRSLNFEQDSQQLWTLTKSLNEEQPARSKIVIEDNGQLLCGKAAANCFAEAYRKQSTIEMSQERIKEVHDDTARKLETTEPKDYMTNKLTASELKAAIRRLKMKKAPGPDGISNEMLKHLGPLSRDILLKIYNQSWEAGRVPSIWKEAHIIPILKKGKSKASTGSYRPISLLSCVGKLLERIINRRLIWHLESNNLISSTQTGYRQHRSTEDQLALLAQDVENALQDKMKTVAVFFDLTAAFDKVWKKGLLLKLLEVGVAGHMYRWTKHFLLDRTARVKLDGTLSHRTHIREGVPQGGVVSPTLFLIYIDGITKCVPRLVSNTLHADDFAIWSSSEHSTTATYRLQETVNSVSSWTKKWGLTISKTKTCTTLFSLSTKKERVCLKLDGDEIPQEDTPTFLGVKLDSRLTWKPHIETTRGKAIRRLALMKKLAGTTWGASSRVLKQVYTGFVRPVLEYSSTTWTTAANTHKAKLDRVQNWGLRMVTGAMKSTPISDMEKTADIEPLENRRQTKVLIQSEKMRHLPSHPLHSRLGGGTKNRLKRKSLKHQVKDLRKDNEEVLQPYHEPCEQLTADRWTDAELDLEIRQTIPGIEGKDSQTPAAQQALALEYLDQEFPADSWTRVYTDGSAIDATINGGSGAVIKQPQEAPVTIALPVGKLCTNFRAEVKAISAAAALLSTPAQPPFNTVILTDSLSTLQALTAKSIDAPIRELQDILQHLSSQRTVTLQWIPAHCGIPGNEQADNLAKQGSNLDQPQTELSFQETRTLLKSHQKNKWRRSNGGYNPRTDSLRLLERRKATMIYRLRTGHCQLRAHLKRLHIADTALCACTQSDQTPAHILQDCLLYAALRNQTWPDGADLDTKLWGSADDLEKTTDFVTSTGLRI